MTVGMVMNKLNGLSKREGCTDCTFIITTDSDDYRALFYENGEWICNEMEKENGDHIMNLKVVEVIAITSGELKNSLYQYFKNDEEDEFTYHIRAHGFNKFIFSSDMINQAAIILHEYYKIDYNDETYK